jgi:hypothetical protein
LTDLERRLAGLEERICRLEESQGQVGASAAIQRPAESAGAPSATPPARRQEVVSAQPDGPPAAPTSSTPADEPRMSMAPGVLGMSGAAALVRIGSLVELGASLFVGGWLYQELTAATTGPQARES